MPAATIAEPPVETSPSSPCIVYGGKTEFSEPSREPSVTPSRNEESPINMRLVTEVTGLESVVGHPARCYIHGEALDILRSLRQQIDNPDAQMELAVVDPEFLGNDSYMPFHCA